MTAHVFPGRHLTVHVQVSSVWLSRFKNDQSEDVETDRLANKQTDSQTVSWVDRQTDNMMDRLTD